MCTLYLQPKTMKIEQSLNNFIRRGIYYPLFSQIIFFKVQRKFSRFSTFSLIFGFFLLLKRSYFPPDHLKNCKRKNMHPWPKVYGKPLFHGVEIVSVCALIFICPAPSLLSKCSVVREVGIILWVVRFFARGGWFFLPSRFKLLGLVLYMERSKFSHPFCCLVRHAYCLYCCCTASLIKSLQKVQ